MSRNNIVGRWSESDIKKLKELWESNVPLDEICKILKRDRKAIYNKVQQKGFRRPIESAT
jgi:predicted transcriptional regulator